MTKRILALVAAVIVSAEPATLNGQQFTHVADPVLNYRGKGRLTLATGIPYLAIGEYAYGISDRVTVGVMAGLTPTVQGYGVRGRAVLYERSNLRVYFCAPVLFYPRTSGLGGDPWWLTRPNINLEWITAAGLRYKIGGSLIAAASNYSLFGNASVAKFPPGLWNAVHGGISIPLGSDVTFQLEGSLVLKGFRVAGKDWVGGPPVILVIGTSWTL
jgi:hypothetical protein